MRTKFLILAMALFAAGSGALAGQRPAGAGSSASAAPVLPPDAKVAGVDFGDWTARWWLWAHTLPVPPYLDPDGRLCQLGQEGPVWFLAGTDGSFTARRKCVVPKDKYLLIPVINMYHAFHAAASDPEHAHPCSVLQARAAVNNDHLVSAVVLIDGKPLPDVARYRVRSNGCFALDSSVPEELSTTAASDGYWLMLKPMSPGRHTLSIGANYGAPDGDGYGNMRQNFEYVLDVGGATDLAVETIRGAAVPG
jgi:hypothetical protein